MRSPELGRAAEDAASSPALRIALAQQTTTLTDELVDGVRTRTRTADESPSDASAAGSEGLPA